MKYYLTGTIRRNRKFFHSLFEASLKFMRNTVAEVQFLLPFVNRVLTFSCTNPLHPHQGRRFSTYVCQKKHVTKPSIAQSYNEFIGGTGALDAAL
jgi:hypothetical protein